MSFLANHEDKWFPEPNTGCYIWIAAATRNGYAQVKHKGSMKSASRIVCEEANGPPPTPEHQAAHNTPNGCVGRICVNDGHLRWASQSENQLDTPPDKRRERQLKAAAAQTLEQHRARGRKAAASRTWEQRSEDRRKAWETRRARR
jgi:hypothetical protein